VGRLAGHILDFCETKLPAFYQALRYIGVERSAARREQALVSTKRHAATGHFATTVEIPTRIQVGCLFSNELIDALPVHRVVQTGGAPREIFVGFDDGQFVEVLAPPSTCAITEYFATQGITLSEGQHAEARLEACDWISEIGRRLERGYVLTIDYGHPAADLFDDHHIRGTLLAYRDHRVNEDFYASPGEQDLTAHVNFTALESWGKRSGLDAEGFTSQTAFLLALGQANEFADLYDEGQTETERMKARLQLKTLIHPEGMGERFQVLLQRKGVPALPLTGLPRIA
jgi:SAM-dependent MidA family methyltransferase